MAPGSPVLADELNAGPPLLLRICAGVLASLGHHLSPVPTTSLSEDFKHVREHFLESHKRLAATAERLKLQHSLDSAHMARAAAVATAITVHSVRAKVPPERGFGIASVGFTEGAKTAPSAGDRGRAP